VRRDAPRPAPTRRRRRIRAALALLAVVALAALLRPTDDPAPVTADPPADVLLSRVPQEPDAARRSAHDGDGRPLAGLQVIVDPVGGGYLGVHFFPTGSGPADFAVALVHSPDLMTWGHVAVLDRDGGNMPVLHALPDGGFLLAYEDYVEATRNNARSRIRVRHYPDRDALLHARGGAEVLLPRTLSRNNEGTPSFDAVAWTGDPTTSTLRLGLHYNAGSTGVDRRARGTLRGFARWTATPDPVVTARLRALGFAASHGKRTHLTIAGRPLTVHEAQRRRGDMAGWGLVLEDRAAGTWRTLAVQDGTTPVTSIGVPEATVLPAPDGLGRMLLVATYRFAPDPVGPMLHRVRLADLPRGLCRRGLGGWVGCPAP